MNRLGVDLQPAAHTFHNGDLFRRNGTVALRRERKQKHAAAGSQINQTAGVIIRAIPVLLVLNIAPRIGDGAIAEEPWSHVVRHFACILEAAHPECFREVEVARVLVADDRLLPALNRFVVVVGKGLRDEFLREHAVAGVDSVEPNAVRLILIDHFLDLAFPGVREVFPFCSRFLVPVEVVVFRVVDIPRLLDLQRGLGLGHESRCIAEGAFVMERGEQFHVVVLADCLGDLAIDIALRAFLHRIPFGELGIPQTETVVVNQQNAAELRPRFMHQPHPLVSVELLGREHRHEVLIAELIEHTVFLDMVGIGALHVFVGTTVEIFDVIRTTEGRHRKDTPVRIDPKLCIFHPLGNRLL